MIIDRRIIFTIFYSCGFAFGGCGDNTNDSSEPSTDAAADDASSSDASIHSAIRIDDVQATVSDTISTVVFVQWSTDAPARSFVEYGLTEELDRATPQTPEASEEHRATLLGLRANTQYYYRVVALSDASEPTYGSIQTVTTSNLPLDLPAITQTGDGHDLFTIVPILGATTAVTIIDSQGEIVWYHLDDRELDIYRARLSVDDQSLLYNAASVSGDPAEDSELVRVALDGTETTTISLPLLAHDFVELPDGTLAAIVVEYRDHEGSTLRGEKIVEVSLDGTQTEIWTTWDCFDPVDHPGDDMAHGWSFANALDYDPEQDVYYLGMRNMSSIVKIDRKTGACLWVLGGPAQTISFAPGTTGFLHQHQFDVINSGIIVFDNEGLIGDESRAVEYQLDLSAGEAVEVWSYQTDPSIYTFVLGEVTRFDGGDTLVNWSTAGQIERVSREGTSKWKINTALGFAFGFHTLAESLYGE